MRQFNYNNTMICLLFIGSLVVLAGCGTALLPANNRESIDQKIHLAKSVDDYFDIQKEIDNHARHDPQVTADTLKFFRAKAVLGKLDITFFRFLSIFSNAANSSDISLFEIINTTMNDSRTDSVFESCETNNCETSYFNSLKKSLEDMEEIKSTPLYDIQRDDIELMRALLSLFYAESLLSLNFDYDGDGIIPKASVGFSSAYENVFVTGNDKITFNEALEIFEDSTNEILNPFVTSEIQTEFGFVYGINPPECNNNQSCDSLTTLFQGNIQ